MAINRPNWLEILSQNDVEQRHKTKVVNKVQGADSKRKQGGCDIPVQVGVFESAGLFFPLHVYKLSNVPGKFCDSAHSCTEIPSEESQVKETRQERYRQLHRNG
jgi:hypothetical protein